MYYLDIIRAQRNAGPLRVESSRYLQYAQGDESLVGQAVVVQVTNRLRGVGR